MELSPDKQILWEFSNLKLSATLVNTWIVMLVLVLVSHLVTRNLVVTGPKRLWQNALEIVVCGIRDTIGEIWAEEPDEFVPFVGTLFLFISISSFLGLVPGFSSPTGSLSTTAALALCVFGSVPVYGIRHRGLGAYLSAYLKPTPLLLPFHVIAEVSRTVSLAVRLFGNMMSGLVLLGVLLIVVPLFVPILVQVLGLLVGQIQAYIFAVLAMVYIAAAASSQEHGKMLQKGKE